MPGEILVKLSQKAFWKADKLLVDTLFSGHYSLHELVYLNFFSIQLANTINNFEEILVSREEKYKKRLVKCFLNVIYFSHLEILLFSPYFTVSNYLVKHWTSFSWA